MGDRAPYSRVYWSVVDDPKFVAIFDDDHHLATWLRLLISADAIWPASPSLPVSARRQSVQALAEAGVVDLQSGYRYRIHGLDAERGRRREAASRAPSGPQVDPKRSPDGPSRARDAMLVSSIGSSLDEGGAGGNDDDPVVAFSERTGSFPADRTREWINEMADTYGESRVTAVIRSTPMTQKKPYDYLIAVRDRLRADEHEAERREAVDERKRNAAKRAPVTEEPWRAEHRRAIEAQYATTNEAEVTA